MQKWKTIRLGTGFRDAEAFRAAIKAFGHIDNWADALLASSSFHIAKNEVEVDLATVSLVDLGFSGGAELSAIYKKALDMGFQLCSSEVGPQLRLQYKEQPMDEWLRIAMSPIPDSEGVPAVFTVGCNRAYSEKWWLRGGSGRPDHGFAASDSIGNPVLFVFVVPRRADSPPASRTSQRAWWKFWI